jgi:hypothetical protein
MENTYKLLIKYTECHLFYNEKACSYIKNRNNKGLYFAHFHSLMKYGILWGNSTIHKVFTVKKRY